MNCRPLLSPAVARSILMLRVNLLVLSSRLAEKIFFRSIPRFSIEAFISIFSLEIGPFCHHAKVTVMKKLIQSSQAQHLGNLGRARKEEQL